jgi:uncharacterized protein
VTDMADILSDETETKINHLINHLEKTNGAEIAVVTVPETFPSATPKAFATELFNYWGIGKANVDNGVLFLISVSDRRVEIETGLGLQSILPNNKVQEIIDTKITPQYKQGNYDKGTEDGTKALIMSFNPAQNKLNWLLFILAGGVGFVLIIRFVKWHEQVNHIYVNPHQTNIDLQRSDSRIVHCAKCRQPMVREPNIQLREAQKIASNLGGVSYRGYQCLKCSNQAHPYVILSYFGNSFRHLACPHCQELTVTKSEEIIQAATQYRKGKFKVITKCQCCDYQTEKILDSPRLSTYSRSSSHNNNSRSHNNNSTTTYVDTGYSNGSYGGGSSSNSDFGGGSSDGGGAGGSW